MDLRPSLLLEMLKAFRTLLLSTASITTASSLILFVAPTATDDDPTKALFYSGGLISGLFTIGLSKALKRYLPIFTILRKADDETFTHIIAAYIYEQKQMTLPEIDQSPVTDELIEIASEQLPETTSATTSEQFPASLITEVGRYVSEGKSDTFLIENVLHCKGRKYQQGKAQLHDIKALISQVQEGQKT